MNALTLASVLLLAPLAISAPPGDGAINALPRLTSPLVVVPGVATPSGCLAVAVDAALLAAVAESTSGACILESVPLAPGVTRSLLLRRAPRTPELVVEVMAGAGSDMTITPLSSAALSAAEGVILVGEVLGEAESRAILSFGPAGTFGIVREGAAQWIISSGAMGSGQPILAFDPGSIDSALLPSTPWVCTAEAIEKQMPPPQGGAADSTAACRQIRLAMDSDFEYFTLLGSDPVAAANYALLLAAAASEITTEGANVRLGLVHLRLWTSDQDPWTQSSAQQQLYQFRNTWNASMGSIERDAAHFLSGRALGGGTAWTGSLCTDKAFSLSSSLNGSFPYPLIDNHPQNWDVIVVAHEISHNLGALHTHQHGLDAPDLCGLGECIVAPQGTVMSYCFLCPGGMANIKLELAPISVLDMLLFLGSVPCEYEAPDASLVAVDDFVVATSGSAHALDLLANDEPANCGAIQLASADSRSANGGTISIDAIAGVALYQAPIAFIGDDSFAYSIVGDGGPAVGQVFIQVQPSSADLDGDGHVNGTDLALMLGAWGIANASADLNGDGAVDGADLALMLGDWTG